MCRHHTCQGSSCRVSVTCEALAEDWYSCADVIVLASIKGATHPVHAQSCRGLTNPHPADRAAVDQYTLGTLVTVPPVSYLGLPLQTA
jgi:hypothetical protein